MTLPPAALERVAVAIIKAALRDSRVDAEVQRVLRRKPLRAGLSRAIARASARLESEDPSLPSALFDLSFLEREGAPVLAEFLVTAEGPDPAHLQIAWEKSLGGRTPLATGPREVGVKAAEAFVRIMRDEITHDVTLRDLANAHALARIAADTRAIRNHVAPPATENTASHAYLEWVEQRNAYLDPRGIAQTQRQVQLKLDAVYVSLAAYPAPEGSSPDRPITERETEEREAEAVAPVIPWLLESSERVLVGTEQWPEKDDLLGHLDRVRMRRASRATAMPPIFLTERAGGKSVAGFDPRFRRRGREAVSSRFNDADGPQQAPSRATAVTLDEAIKTNPFVVILGDPGAGKTTLLRYLALQHARRCLGERVRNGEQIGAAVPISIRIADYAEGGRWKETSLTDFLQPYLALLECPDPTAAGPLLKALEAGRGLILFDGLDEIVNPDDRRGVVKRLEDFVARWGGLANRVVVTSRVAGYHAAPLRGRFTHFRIDDMDEAQIAEFLSRWCAAVEFAETPDLSEAARAQAARREADGIMTTIRQSPGVRRLAVNPLLLTVLALLHRTGARLPEKRVELYKLAADTLAGSWRLAQGVPASALADERNVIRMLSHTGYWMHREKPSGLAPHAETSDRMAAEWARLSHRDWDPGRPDPDIEEEVARFLAAVRIQTGLFVERATKRYGFMHLTFEEYFAARFLVRRVDRAAVEIRKVLHDPRWEEPILLAIGFVGLDYPETAAELVDTAIFAGSREGPASDSLDEAAKWLGLDFLMALQCVADGIPVSAERAEEMVRRICSELFDRQGCGRHAAYRALLLERVKKLAGSSTAADLAKASLNQDLTRSGVGLAMALTVVAFLRVPSVDNVEALLRHADHPSGAVRELAVRALVMASRSGLSDDAVGFLAAESAAGEPQRARAAGITLLAADAPSTADISRTKLEDLTVAALSSDMVEPALLAVAASEQVPGASVVLALLDAAGPEADALAPLVLSNIALGDDGFVAKLLGWLDDESVRRRERALDALLSMRQIPSNLEERLRQGLAAAAEPEWYARALYRVADRLNALQPASVQMLCDHADDSLTNEEVRLSAVTALIRSGNGTRAHYKQLVRTYATQSGQFPALESVVSVTRENIDDIAVALEDALDDDGPERLVALDVMLHAEAAFPMLEERVIRVLASPEPEQRRAAVRTLTRYSGSPRAGEAVGYVAQHDSASEVRVEAVRAITGMSSDLAWRVDLLEAVLSTDELTPEVEAVTTLQLVALGQRSEGLKHMLRDAVWNSAVSQTRSEATRALGQLDDLDEATWTTLLHAFRSDSEAVVAFAAQALVQLAVSNPHSDTDLIGRLRDAAEDAAVSETARFAAFNAARMLVAFEAGLRSYA